MKTENKSSSTAIIVTVTAIALIGCSAYAIRSGMLSGYINKRRLKNKDEAAALGSQIEVISAQNAFLRQNAELLSISLEKMTIQNEKLMASNNAIALALGEERDSVVRLMNIISEENAEKLVLTRKLEEANSKISMMGFMPEEAKSKTFIA